ncbi:MAG: aminopeptidase P family protein [Rhodospirillaceae bacterium]|nr:aminopeptidase P family protein [Rhodospirillaceae bacterium]
MTTAPNTQSNWQQFCASQLAKSLASRSAEDQVALHQLALGLAAAPPTPPHFDLAAILPDWLDDGDTDALNGWISQQRQRFEDSLRNASPHDHHHRLAALRQAMADAGIDVWLIPRTDPYLNEYTPIGDERLWWLNGFSGSTGMAVVLRDQAALFVDSRYTLQAAQQVDTASYQMINSGRLTPRDWLKPILASGAVIGFDPWLISATAADIWAGFCAKQGWVWRALTPNLIDGLWTDQPPAPLSPTIPLPVTFSGQPASEKLAQLRQDLQAAGCDAALFSTPDSVAWILNVRGADVPCCPLPLSRLLLLTAPKPDQPQAYWLVDSRKVTAQVQESLPSGVAIVDPGQLSNLLAQLPKQASVQLDGGESPIALVQQVTTAGLVVQRADNPAALPRAVKNVTELDGIRLAHRKDGVALTKFFCWLAQQTAHRPVGEIEASDYLLSLRAMDPAFVSESFAAISGAGANGAIVHYRAAPATEAMITPNMLYLLDSGGQYLHGTTDVTRTVAIGQPTAEQRRHFTLVLRGHIALARAQFPSGTSGAQLDALARQPLWQAGLDFDHGTGHGVGHFLNVHEGPQGISKRAWSVPLKPGMILSNEPGYYLDGAYGIRIESLVAVQDAATAPGFLRFETLTLAAIDRNLIDAKLLGVEGVAWLNSYHARVYQEISPFLSPAEQTWLQTATAAL